MVNQTDTLARLNKEKDYEDKLVSNLSDYFIDSLEMIETLSAEDKNKIKDNLTTIRNDSIRHSYMFNQLIQRVMENGEDNY